MGLLLLAGLGFAGYMLAKSEKPDTDTDDDDSEHKFLDFISDTPDDFQTGTPLAMLDHLLAWLPGGFTSEQKVKDAARYLLDGEGTLYYYGRPVADVIRMGDIKEAKKSGGDCSGITGTVLVHAGIVSSEWPIKYRRADDMRAASASDSVAVGSQRPGDIACYNGHVTLVITDPIAELDGHSYVLSMSGGDSSTFGNNLNARAKIMVGNYRSSGPDQFIGYFRPKE